MPNKQNPMNEEEVKEQVAERLEHIGLGCLDGGDYRLCSPYCENPRQVADLILALVKDFYQQQGRRDVVDWIRSLGRVACISPAMLEAQCQRWFPDKPKSQEAK